MYLKILKKLNDMEKYNLDERSILFQVTDIIKTPKGFPSVGYTYQRNPYGVFEDGSGSAPWANGQRDPRQLIDGSIREVAAKMAIGRFYTRRV